MLYEQLTNDIKTALVSHNELAKNTYRGLKSAIDTAVKNGESLSDDLVIKIAASEIKRRRDAISMYEKGGAADRAANEQAEIDLITVYLPKQLTTEELTAAVTAAISELNATTPADMGRVMGHLKEQLGASADGATLANLVKEQLSRS